MKKNIVVLFLLLFCVFILNEGVVTDAQLNMKSVAAAKKKINPYSIVVDTSNQQVRIYKTLSGVKLLVKKYICSTGAPATPTPHGTFYMGSFRSRFGYFTKYDCWAQYMMQISGDILFHSVLYSEQDTSTLIYSSLYNLGKPVSHGCVRLRPENAKWMWTRCTQGTKITVGSYPVSAAKASLRSFPAGVSLNKKKAAVKYGTKLTLKAKIKSTPGLGKVFKKISWKSSKTTVAVVNAKGVVTPKGIGTTVITVIAAGGKKARCTVTVNYRDVTGIRVLPEQLNMLVGETKKLKVDLSPTKSNPKVTYVSLDNGIAGINAKGVVTAYVPGQTMIEVRAHNGKKAICKIVVTELATAPPEQE